MRRGLKLKIFVVDPDLEKCKYGLPDAEGIETIDSVNAAPQTYNCKYGLPDAEGIET